MNIPFGWITSYIVIIALMGLTLCIIAYPLFFQGLGAALALLGVVWVWIAPGDFK